MCATSEPECVGTAESGRPVYLSYAENSSSVIHSLRRAHRPFALFLGWDTEHTITDGMDILVESVLDAGARYIMLWGKDAGAVEDHFDEVIVGPRGESKYGDVVTTSHGSESIEDALAFATSRAVEIPDSAEPLASVVIVWIGNINRYNEAQNVLEDLLA